MIELMFGSWGRFWQDAAFFLLMGAVAVFTSGAALWLIFRERDVY